MSDTLCSAEQWADRQFSATRFGDKRRTRRLVKVAQRLARHPNGTLPSAFSAAKELKAAYRLFSNQAVDYQSILEPHCQQTLEQCQQPGEYLFIEDRSSLDYSSHRATRGLGRIGNDRGTGFMLHTTLAAHVQGWTEEQQAQVQLVGILAQSCWARTSTSARAKKERWRQRLSRSRESEHWAAALQQLGQRDPAVRWIYIADRESDIYEVFERAEAAAVDYIVRAQFARALAQEDRSVFEAIAAAPVMGRFELPLRTRGEARARTAELEVRTRSVRLRGVWRPQGNRPDLEVNVVEVRETTQEQPIHWVLLTSLPCADWTQVRRIIERYSRRWLIEEYHKALKSGANVEASQLESAEGLQALLGVLAVVAIRLLNVKLVARSRPDKPMTEEILGAEELTILGREFGKPAGGWTYGRAILAIARMGGFLARAGDGFPGWLTIWRGWQRLTLMAQGARIFSSPQQ